MKPHSKIQTQFLIFTLFGDFIEPHGGETWTVSLLKLLDLLDVSERAARSTLSRMSQKGWLESERVGRYSRYQLTPRGKHIIEEGGARIFEPRQQAWDGRWHMVVYTIPEEKRSTRNDLRKRLRWLGFGDLAPGVWISPTDRRERVEADLEDLEAKPYTVYFSDMELNFADNQEIVDRCWDLGEINQMYGEFLDRYEPLFEECQRADEKDNGLSPARCFRHRFWLSLDYAQFPRLDPNLPPELLPEDWLGERASELFFRFRDYLADRTDLYLDQVLNSGPDGKLDE